VPALRSSFARFRFPPEVIMLAVRWYLRYSLSYRDVKELLAERGIVVDHVTIYRWVQRFTPELIDAARPSRHVGGDRWFVDETYLKVAGRWVYLYRAIDQHGQVIDVFASPKRDLAATRQFFTRALNSTRRPTEVTTDRHRPTRVIDELVVEACHKVEQYQQPDRSRSRAVKGPDPSDAGPETATLRPGSAVDMRSSKTCAVDTTNSDLMLNAAGGSRRSSLNSRLPSEQAPPGRGACLSAPTQQRRVTSGMRTATETSRCPSSRWPHRTPMSPRRELDTHWVLR